MLTAIDHKVDFQLREWKQNDATFLARYAANPLIWNQMTNNFPTGIDEIEKWIEKTRTNFSLPTAFAIDINGEAIGSIAAILKHKEAELGYWLSPLYWNKGIMTRAVRQMVEYLFENFDVERIYSEVLKSNINSAKVLEKAGFKKARTSGLMGKWNYSLHKKQQLLSVQ